MNKFFKLTPVVAAAIALVGCSNDDFFGGANEGVNSNLPSIAVSVEAPTISRANLYETGVAENPLVFDWIDGDELRVYDAAVQKYDNFAWATNKFVLNNESGEQYVGSYIGATEAENAYALYSGGNFYDGDEQAVSYSGWKQNATGGVPVALVSIPHDLQYYEDKLSTDASITSYKSNIPLWGRVKEPVTADAKFSAELKWLTSYVRVRFENANKLLDPIKTVKVKAMKFKSTVVTAADKTAAKAKEIKEMKEKDVTTFQFATGGNKTLNDLLMADADKPLNGWFEAELKDGGQMVDTDDDVVAQPNAETRNELVINVEGLLEANQNYIYLPIISGVTYEALAITYTTEGATANDTDDKEYIAGVYFDYAAERAKGKTIGIGYPNTNYILDGTTPAKVTKAIKENYDGKTSSVLYFNKTDENAQPSQFMTVSAGAPAKYTIYLPQISKNNLEVHITNKNEQATKLEGADLIIADAAGIDNSTATGVVTLVIDNIANPDAAQKVIVNSKANVVLAGNFSEENVKVQAGDNCANLTLGIAGDEEEEGIAFNYGGKVLTVAKGNLTVNNITYTASTAEPEIEYNNASGTLVVASQVKTVTVTDATSATIAAPVTTVDALKNVTINVPYNATPAKMTVGTLNIHKGVTAIKLDGGIISTVKNDTESDTKTVNTDNVTVTSTGLSAIKAVNFTVGNISFTSSFAVSTKDGDPTSVDALTSGGDDNPTLIYTGAQLAAVGTTASVGTKGFKLATKITALTNWTSPNLAKKFDGAKAASNGLTIAGVDAPLFGTVTADIENVALTCAFPETSKANGVGGLAKAAGAADINVKNVTVGGHIYGSYNVGGIFGTTGANTVIIGANNADVVVSAAFHNTSSYDSPYNGRTPRAGTFGTIIGQAGTGAVTLTNGKVSDTNATFDKAALYFNYNRLEDEDGNNIWQFKGNTKFIGYSPAATSLEYGNKKYTNAWVDPYSTDADKKVKYDVTKKKVTGTVRIINSSSAVAEGTWYTAKDAVFKAKMTGEGGLLHTDVEANQVAEDADWSGLTVEVHNSWEAFTE